MYSGVVELYSPGGSNDHPCNHLIARVTNCSFSAHFSVSFCYVHRCRASVNGGIRP